MDRIGKIMAKKELGSVTRTAIAVVSGVVIGKSVDGGLSVETIEMIATHLETIIAVLGIVVVQLWSFVDKQKHKNLEKKVEKYENLND
jgi:FtsH-binding integral membrane protein